MSFALTCCETSRLDTCTDALRGHRSLLDALTERTLFVSHGRLELRVGSYTRAAAQREAERERQEALRAQHVREEHQFHRAMLAAAEQLRSASASRSVGPRVKDRYDSDARSVMAKDLAENAEEHLFVLPQDLDEARALEAVDTIRALPREDRRRVLSLVAALGGTRPAPRHPVSLPGRSAQAVARSGPGDAGVGACARRTHPVPGSPIGGAAQASARGLRRRPAPGHPR
ncbi:hypothetical protein [Vitiosangium sp. GDMCC 1.1324]|uniref:hypothetical protein n=1 Tax=Vitiosangium sp. (strain GDMCC 1.1324) TaxID=2138576 RepID=UPI001E439FE9|nr:hypothetical protein [Vitiosangium sp. GDMCC 1.1324]